MVKARLEDLLAIRGSYSLAPGQREAITRRYEAELAEEENRLFFAGFDDGQPVAYVQLLLNEADGDPVLADGKGIAHVHDLRVHRELQGKGQGRALIFLLEQEARRRAERKMSSYATCEKISNH